MKHPQRLLYTFLGIAALILVDHLAKWAAIAWLKDSNLILEYGWGVFRLQYAENTGAFLSLGANLPDGMRALVMIGLNAVILAGLVIYLSAAKHIPRATLIALICIAGGGIGNMIDRLFRDGRVVDYMNLGVPPQLFHLRTGIFNIADVAIMAGLFLIIAQEIFAMKSAADNSPSSPPSK